MNAIKRKIATVLAFLIFVSCNTNDDTKATANDAVFYKTKNVIIILIDGPRFSETWDEPTHQYIPRQAGEMLQEGVFYSSFRNEGATYTTPGHTAIATGVYQQIDNGGEELPNNPSFMQYWRAKYDADSSKSWHIASKDKLEVLSNCKNPEWKNQFKPSTDCGVNGNGSGYRPDLVTYQRTLEILSQNQPQLVLINFREPDYSGHGNDWNGYLKGISNTDEFVFQVWNYIKSDPFYKDETTLFITNDHGRHLDGVFDGFVSHGDSCEGCRHISLYAYGPDFKQNHIENTPREQIDISATIGELLDFEVPTSQGEVMLELFN